VTAARHLGIRVDISPIVVAGYALVVDVSPIGYRTVAYAATLIRCPFAVTTI